MKMFVIALRGFCEGLLKPSLTAVVVSLSLATTLVMTALFGITSERIVPIIRWHQQYVQAGGDVQFITAEGFDFLASGSTGPGIVLLGGSTVRESVDVSHLRGLLGVSRQSLEVHNLSFSAQRMIDSIALIDFIPPNFRGIVVVGINPGRVGRRLDAQALIHDRRVGILGDSLINEARHWPVQPPERTDLYALDNRHFLLAFWNDIVRILPRALRGRTLPRGSERHFYLNKPLKSDALLERDFSELSALLKDYDLVARENLEALQRLHLRLNQRGLRMVLIEVPLNPLFVRYWGEDTYNRHLATMQSFAARNAIPYLVNITASPLQPVDFADWGHFRTSSARLTFTEALEAKLRPFVREWRQ